MIKLIDACASAKRTLFRGIFSLCGFVAPKSLLSYPCDSFCGVRLLPPKCIVSAFLMIFALISCNRNFSDYRNLPTIWEIEVPRVSISAGRFWEVLDSLSDRENRCRPFDSALVWRVQTLQVNPDSCTVIITRMREASDAYGYQSIGNRLFFFDGAFIPSLFRVEEESREFSGDNDGGIPYPETYSTWVYTYAHGQLILKNAWPFPCRN